MADVAPAKDAIDFAERALALLDEGLFTATYKFAVLLALMDVCLERTSPSGAAPQSVATAVLAEKVIELWPQVAAFAALDAGPVLRQNAGRHEAVIVARVLRFRQASGPDPTAALSRSRVDAPVSYHRLLDEVEAKLIQMPLPRLQVLGGEETRFIYDYDFSAKGIGEIRLVGRAGDYLFQLSGLLRPIIQRRWADTVRRINRQLLGESELDEFLFGSERTSLSPVRAPLHEMQGGRCFYCGGRMKNADIDHFLPWARHPDNGIFNLVAAHPSCNNSKRDFLASVDHVREWRARLDTSAEARDFGSRLLPRRTGSSTPTGPSARPEVST